MEIIHESTVVDDRQTLLDARVGERSTVTVTLVPGNKADEIEGAPAGPMRIQKNLSLMAAREREFMEGGGFVGL